MKNFQNFTPQKYMTSDFQKISDGIYKTKSPYDYNDIFVTSLTFEMEPECYGEENASPSNLTQIPIEGILDEFNLFVTDFYEQLNQSSEIICYQGFGSLDLEDTKTAAAKFRALCIRVRCHARTESKEPQHFCIAETAQSLCEYKRAVQITTA